MKVGRRLAIKILNATKFVLTITDSGDIQQVTDPLDLAMLARLGETVKSATAAFEDFNYAKALDLAETFFWSFTDDYVELVKERAYGESDGVNTQSARSALYVALTTQLRLFAPFLPFTTEETWSWFNDSSVHAQAWPEVQTGIAPGDPQLLANAQAALGLVRKAKSEAKASMRAEIQKVVFTGIETVIADLLIAQSDLLAAGSILEFETVIDADATELRAEVTLSVN
jgi:valyl-tRNA synthetase